MKKKIFSFILMICILLSFTAINASAASDSEMPVSISSVECYYADSTVIANVTFDYTNEDCKVILAIYDAGKFVTANQKALSAGEVNKTIEIRDIDDSYIGYEAKILCWGGDDFLTPLTSAFETQITEESSSGGDTESEVITRLKAVSNEIAPFLDRSNPSTYTVFNSRERSALKKIKACIDDAVVTHYDVLNKDDVDPDFIETTYEAEIDEIYDVVYVDMTEDEREAFKGKLASNFDQDNLIWLADTLGIDLADYGITTQE